jgi:hypothetical protein
VSFGHRLPADGDVELAGERVEYRQRHARVSPVIGAIGRSSGAETAGGGSGSACARSKTASSR